MAQLLAYQKTGTTTLTAATIEVSDFLQRVKLGEWVHADFKRVRNYLFHKRFFKLLQFGFEFWIPTGGIVTPGERELFNGFIKHLIHLSGLQSSRVISEAAEEYLLLTGQQRSGDLVLLKSFEPFRAWVTVEAGFYYEAILSNGFLHRYPKSISFVSMDNLSSGNCTNPCSMCSGTTFCSAPSERNRRRNMLPCNYWSSPDDQRRKAASVPRRLPGLYCMQKCGTRRYAC